MIHNRMPVILPSATWPLWLGEDAAEPEQLKAVLRPYPAEETTCWPVSTRFGNVRNNAPVADRTDRIDHGLGLPRSMGNALTR
jgi:putative SOS response-associated peptidase YedK